MSETGIIAIIGIIIAALSSLTTLYFNNRHNLKRLKIEKGHWEAEREEERKRWLADKIIERQIIDFRDFYSALINYRASATKCFFNTLVNNEEALHLLEILLNRFALIDIWLSNEDYEKLFNLLNVFSDIQKELLTFTEKTKNMKKLEVILNYFNNAQTEISNIIKERYLNANYIQKYIEEAKK